VGSITLITRSQAIETLRINLNVGLTCTPRECQFELLRIAVWGMAAPHSQVHVSKIINSILAAWRLLSPEETNSEEELRFDIRESLSALEATGDLIELGHGHWTSASTRIIDLPDRKSKLLVGGLPTSFLDLAPDAIYFHGPHRHLSNASSLIASSLPSESLNSWVGLPKASLRDWASEYLQASQLTPFYPNTCDSFEFYLPQFAKRYAPQFKRWFGNAKLITGVHVARRRRVYGAKEYRLVELKTGQITKSCELQASDFRRLMYAYDLEVNNPVRVKVYRKEQFTEWLFASELPLPEQRAFGTIGTLDIPVDRPYQRKWNFRDRNDFVRNLVSCLGIEIAESLKDDS
jgi:hypothetical protein